MNSKKTCPDCGHTVFTKLGYRYNRSGRVQMLRCKLCRRVFPYRSGDYDLRTLTVDEKQALLIKQEGST